MKFDKKARIPIVLVLLTLAASFVFFVLAENSSDNLTLPIEDNISLNITLENQTLNLTLPSNETVLINETLILPPENVSYSEPPEINNSFETTEETLNSSAENFSMAEEAAPTTFNNSNNYDGRLIDYRVEQEGDITHLYPNMLIDEFSFTSLSSSPLFYELGRTESAVGTFITTFVIDTTATTFTEGSFTKRVEGKELYLCPQWDQGCLTNWIKIQDLPGEEYTLSFPPGKIAYGETLPAQLLGISSEISSLASISSTQADGLIAYGESNIALPRYRTWNSSNNFSAEQNAQSIGTAGTDDITWAVVRGNHERDEIILGTEDKSNDVNIQVYNSTAGAWGGLLEVSADVPNSAYRAFDIAVEDLSGDALIVYETSSTADTTIAYRMWNGSYSAESTLTTGLGSLAINWVQLVSRRGADDIMLLVHDSSSSLRAIPWNGTGFDTSKAQTLSTTTISATTSHFDFAWEGTSNQGLALYGLSTALGYRTFSLTAPYWSTGATISLSPQNGRATRLCADPVSDYIGIVRQASANDVGAYMWDGTQILAGEPAEDSLTEPMGSNNPNVDCAWYNSSTALFGFVDNNALAADYFTFTKTNTWSTADLTSTSTTSNFASNDIGGMRFTKHPTTNEIMITIMDTNEDISLIRWTGTAFASIAESPIETNTEVINGDQEGVMFDWYRYDPVPNVTSISPSGINHAVSSTININATVRDNIGISVVLANITLPNSTISQITLTDTNSDNIYNSTFSTTNLNGIYTIRIIANDSSVHQNINSTETITFTVGDYLAPNVTNVAPTAGTNYNLNTLINISANVTDNINISVVLANITLPNGTIKQITLTNKSLVNYNGTFNITNTAGTYTIRIIANDTVNNINSSETTTFTIGDVILPSVTNVTPISGTNYEAGTVVNISANVTDETAVGAVLANITFPNSSIEQVTLINRSLAYYNGTFRTTSATGTYTVRIIANDTTNNVNSSETTTFTIGDTIPPSITINAPADRINFSATSVVFNITVTDASVANANCSLLINGTVNQTNSSVLDNINTLFNISGFLERDYQWNVSCNDSSGNTNASILRRFAIDITVPQFNTLTTSPSAAADLDPNTNVTVLVNVTDNRTAVQSVIFQYKLTNDTEYTNVTMAFFSGSGFYNTSFNATRNGTYDLRVWASDLVRNSDFSNTINILVEYDHNWTRTPALFAAVVASASASVTLGNLTINNSGDVSLSFNITSSSSTTRYNGTENFTLAAGETRILQVNDTAPAGGLKTITLNISVNDSLAVPRSLTAEGKVVVAPGQPVLVATITTPAEETKSVTQGDTGVAFAATLQNIGEGNATNVTFFFTLPSGWTVTFGQTNLSRSSFDSGESLENNIEVTIPSNAATGTFTVVVNSTGLNSSGTKLENESLVFGDTVSVTISAAAGVLGGISGGGAAAAGAAAAAEGGGGGVGAGAGKVTQSIIGAQKQTIKTEEVFAVPRGSGASTPITVANLWENAVMEDINLEVSGFLAQYVIISPELNRNRVVEILATLEEPQTFSLPGMEKYTLSLNEVQVGRVTVTIESEPQTLDLRAGQIRYVDLDGDAFGDIALELVKIMGGESTIKAYAVKDFSQVKLAQGETLNYSLDIYAPTYLVQKDYELELEIEATLIPKNATAAGFTKKVITEFRKLLFRIQEMGGEEAEQQLALAREQVQEMTAAQFNTGEVQNLMVQAEQALTENDYDLVGEITEKIATIHQEAFAADEIIQQVREALEKAQGQWLKTPQANQALQLTLVAFERGDYTTALERAKNAQLISVLETKGRVNILKFVIDWWWALLIGSIALSILTYFIYKSIYITIIEQRLDNLNKEEKTIGELLEETQRKYFMDKTISEAQFKRYTEQYEKRLAKIGQVRAKLRNKRVAILKTEQELKSIQKEKMEVEQLRKQNQTDYLVKGKLSRKKFTDLEEQHKGRLTEIEQEESILQEKLEQQKGMRKYGILSFIRRMEEGFTPEKKAKIRKEKMEKKKPKEKVKAKKQRVKEQETIKPKKAEQKEPKPRAERRIMVASEKKEEAQEREEEKKEVRERPKKEISEEEEKVTNAFTAMFSEVAPKVKPRVTETPLEKPVKEETPGEIKEKFKTELIPLQEKRTIREEPNPTRIKEKISWFSRFKKPTPKIQKPDPYAGKWVEIKIPDKNIFEAKIIPDGNPSDENHKEKVKVTNTPKKEVKQMSKEELKKWFPGAFE